MTSTALGAPQVWAYGREVWIQPAAGCTRCARLWRGHSWSPENTATPGGWSRSLVEAHLPLVAMRSANVARRIDKLNGLATDHVFAPHPDCARHPPSLRTSSKSRASDLRTEELGAHFRGSDLRTIERNLAGLVDSHLGQVRRIDDFRSENPISGAAAQLRPLGGPGSNEYGYGRSGNAQRDRVVALIEALERRSGFKPDSSVEIVTASRDAIRDLALDPERIILPSPTTTMSHFAAYSNSTVYEWVWGWSAKRRGPVMVPRQLVYFGESAPLGGRFAYEVSNGCAAGSSVAEATMFGILEVIERDAFLTSWHSGRTVDRLCTSLLDEWGHGLINRLAAEGVETTLLDIGCGLPGTAIAVEMICREGPYLPVLAYAAASHPDPRRAANGALQEVAGLFQRVDAVQLAKRQAAAKALLRGPHTIATMEQHAAQGDAHEALSARRFSISESPPSQAVGFAEGMPAADVLQAYLDAIVEDGFDVIVCDLSYSPVREHGLHCVKVLIPGLHSMTFGHDNVRLSPDRLRRLAPPERWRPEPHPFP